ncbi:MAG TPA: DUF1800 domain-containing protein, partial [Planctomycetota bacterium]|nr:DUF1800 domain-containing protein [Planctomycetota bacterium]
TLFWHNHFATSAHKVENPAFMSRQIELFRRYAAGNFRSLLLEVSSDPAMLVYLDGRVNRKAAPNENYAREVMELFTIGIGHYGEKDVKEAARAFTGWTIQDGRAVFEPKQHDDGEKEVLGRKGKLGTEDVVDVLAAHRATAKRLSLKLAKEFLSPDPDGEVVEAMAAEYLRSGYDVRAVLRVLFTSKAFRSDAALFARVKSPVELVIGALRALPGIVPLRQLTATLRRMGQDLFAPPTVKGWDGGRAWLSTSTLLNRVNFAKDVAAGVGNNPSPALDARELVRRHELDSAEKLVAHMLDRFGPLEVTPTVCAKLVEYVQAAEMPKAPAYPHPSTIDGKVRGVAHLVMSLPEYQLC